MRQHRLASTLFWLAGLLGVQVPANAQISPGELSAAHAALEGMGKCTSCHEVGRTVSDSRCLTCHNEIGRRVDEHRGLHALYGGRHCVECHKEHHGRRFDIVHFDERAFSHAQTGFVLEGAHARLECRKCHNSEHVRDRDLLSRPSGVPSRTFLGLAKECQACHRDVHAAQLGAACADCHGTGGWKPATAFSHDRSRFKLTGAHGKVGCERCHTRRADGIVAFRGIVFSSCKACHNDPHQGKFKQNCEECHSVQGWKEGARTKFSHSETRFPLTGKHMSVECARCHPARGFHVARFGMCEDCHRDPHRGQFAATASKGTCEACHTTSGFSPSIFTAARHQSTRFMLDGAHSAVPCVRCHRPDGASGGAARFRWDKPSDCRNCHEDIHKGSLAGVMASGCVTCHSTTRWDRVSFAHDGTRFPLTGAHAVLACWRCHLVDGVRTPVEAVRLSAAAAPRRMLRWEGAITCTLCHADPHTGQFQKRNGGRCDGCHTTRKWQELLFSHDSTAFTLTGAHARVPCERCHRTVDAATSGTGRQYAGVPTACAACHGKATTR